MVDHSLRPSGPTPPYLTYYKKEGRELVYIAARHTRNGNNPTLKIVEDIFSKYTPNVVIIEKLIEQRERYLEQVRECHKTKQLQVKCGEADFAVHKALRNNIEFIGAEPRYETIYNALINQGVTKNEIIFFFIFREISLWERRNFKPKNVNAEIQRLLKITLRRFKIDRHTFTASDFFRLYKSKLKRDFNFATVTNMDIAPALDGHYIQRLSSKVDQVREFHILKVVERSLREHRKILIVYGYGHFLKHQNVLEDFFGDAGSKSLVD